MSLWAQEGNNPYGYLHKALQYSSQNLNGDAGAGLFPSVASAHGYGSFIDNPASMALLDKSSVNFSFYNNQVEHHNMYLGNALVADDSATQIGSIGFVYQMPVERGSMVIGAGYNQLIHQLGRTRIKGRNSENTITDSFKFRFSDHHNIAFNTYAIDWGDADGTYTESIFRIGFDRYPGITQEAEITYNTDIGEYSAFVGTEFKKGIFVGISFGHTVGTYSYSRNFYEIDTENDYNYNFIPSDSPGDSTDIDNIWLYDKMKAEVWGYNVRGGLIYQITPNINIGISYLAPYALKARESYSALIRTELDDGSTPFQDEKESDEDLIYKVKNPGQLKIGVTANNIGPFSVSVSGEYIDYSELKLITGLKFDNENDFIEDNYKEVFNIKTGVKVAFTDITKFKAGYAYLPGKSKKFAANRNVFFGGISSKLSSDIILEVSGQYSMWDDRSVAYDYENFSGDLFEQTISKQSNSLFIQTGVKFLF